MNTQILRPNICIIGGGLCGLVTAYYLQQLQPLKQANIFILEATSEVGGGSIFTCRADAGKIYRLLHFPKHFTQQREPFKKQTCADPETHQAVCSDVVATLKSELLLGYQSVNPEGLRVDSGCEANDGSETNESSCDTQRTIALDFGITTPHLSAPGGGHVLQLASKLMLPSDIIFSRRENATLFALPRGQTGSAAALWPLPSRTSIGIGTSAIDPDRLRPCRAGLSRMQMLRAVGALARQVLKLLLSRFRATRCSKLFERGSLLSFSSRTRTSQTTTTQIHSSRRELHPSGIVEDTSVWDFAISNATKALASEVLLPGFSACTYAGIPSALSASAYFPRALLLQKLYGSFLYGALAERWKSKSPRNLKCKESDELLTRSDSTKKGEKLPSKLVSVKGATALTSEDATYQMIASEGRGIFSFRGGIRKLVKELERYITEPPSPFKPVNIYFNSEVSRIFPHIADCQTAKSNSTVGTEIVCSNGSKFSADLVISAVHPYELASILSYRPSERMIHTLNAHRREGECTIPEGICDDDKRSSANPCSTLAAYLVALPSVSWVSIHAFAADNGPRARQLGMGCFYPTKMHFHPNEHATQSRLYDRCKKPETVQKDSPVLGLIEAIRRAKQSVEVTHLRLLGNLFPHAQELALAAAGLGDPIAAPWVTSAQLLHAHAEVRIHDIEYVVQELEELLLPLKDLSAKKASQKAARNPKVTQDAGVQALAVIMLAAEDAVVRSLLREGLVTRPEDLLLTSRLAAQAALEWPLNLELMDPPMGSYIIAVRRRLRELSRSFESLGERSPRDPLYLSNQTLPLHAEPARCSPSSENRRERVPLSAARRRIHELRRENYPWLQIVGAAGCLSEWGIGASVKDAAIVAHQIQSRFDAFPVVNEERCEDFEARLNGGWRQTCSSA